MRSYWRPSRRFNGPHHEPNEQARRINLAGIARRIAHLAEHGFVERAKSVKLAAGSEMDAGNLVDDVAQQVAADHAVQPALNLLRACCERDVSVMLRWIFDGTSMVLRWFFDGSSKDFGGFHSFPPISAARPPAVPSPISALCIPLPGPCGL